MKSRGWGGGGQGVANMRGELTPIGLNIISHTRHHFVIIGVLIEAGVL